MKYACIAGVPAPQKGLRPYRCRGWAVDPPANPFCPRHPDEKNPILAPIPDRVLVKLTLPRIPDNLRDLEDFNFHFADRDREKQAALETKHAQHAEAVGRGAYVVRGKTSDSGVQVFGPDGLRDMSLLLIDGGLVKAELVRAGAHVLDITHEGRLVLVIEYSLLPPQDRATPFPPRAEGYVRSLLRRCWGITHVWANPPRFDNGVIVHTVNAGKLRSDEVPLANIVFSEGHWGFISGLMESEAAVP